MRSGISDGAFFQAYETRVRLSAQLVFRLSLGLSSLWLILTTYVVWYATGIYLPALGHQYFFRWILCDMLTSVPLVRDLAAWLPMYAHGALYSLPSFGAWLDGPQFYQQSFPVWFWWYGRWTALTPLGLVLCAMVWRLRHRLDLKHIRGLQLITPQQHNRQLNGRQLITTARCNDGFQIGASVVPRKLESSHIMICGQSGSGKSTLIRLLLRQIRERQQPAVIVDVESEYIREFYNPATDIVLQPLDDRAPFWTPWHEIELDNFAVDAEALAASLIRGQTRNENERFFQESARTLIEALLEVVKHRDDCSEIQEILARPRDQLQQRLAGTAAYVLIDPSASEQGVGILSVAQNAIKAWRYLPRRDHARRSFSARAWGRNPEGWIFLSCQENARAAIQRQQGCWLDAIVRSLMEREIGASPVSIVGDEFTQMGFQPVLAETALPRGRKRNICCILAFQTIAQLRATYTHDGAVNITSSPAIKCILQADETETATWCAELLGKHEVDRWSQVQMSGLSSYREGINLQPARVSELLVTADEIKHLEPGHGYLAIAGQDRTTLKFDECDLVPNQPAFVRRTKPATLAAAPAGKAVRTYSP
jgi:energy-coupling factor transporter ATP-binding protein EcfA2